MEHQIEKAFIQAIVTTFTKQLQLEVTQVRQKPEDAPQSHDISGVIGFLGAIVGNVALQLSESTAQKLVSRLVGEEVTQSDSITDGIGELVNMIAGNAKVGFGEKDVYLSLPEVIRGKGHELNFRRCKETIQLCFSSEIGIITLVAAYNPRT